LLLTWAVATPPLLAQPATANPFHCDAEQIDIGRSMFRIYCAPCHGIHAQGGRGPDLTRGVYNAGEQDSDLFRVIADGVRGTETPARPIAPVEPRRIASVGLAQRPSVRVGPLGNRGPMHVVRHQH
jgi:cytochrome c oxidase cbb3-type subunit 3